MKGKMISLSCKCHNVNIECDNDCLSNISSQDLGRDQVDSTSDIIQDDFFSQEIKRVHRPFNISFVHPTLVVSRSVETWSVAQCSNCNVSTHAVMTGSATAPGTPGDKNDGFILINAKLSPTPGIETLKTKNSFSKVYKILIFPTTDKDERRYDYLPAEVEKSIRALKQKADDYINTETLASEERIRIYTEQQLQVLNDFTERTELEHRTLARNLLKHLQTGSDTRSSTNGTHHAAKQERRASCLRKVPDTDTIVSAKTPSPQNKSLTILDQSPTPTRKPLEKKNSLDAECLFELDGMSDVQSGDESEMSENEDNGIGIPIKNRSARNEQMNIAKSLPMNIPVYMRAFRSQLIEDSDEEPAESEEATDIAASIQALARSVNGDTVFGDLPRNKCMSHI